MAHLARRPSAPVVVLLAVACAAAASPAPAQDPAKGPLPITVTAAPSKLLPADSVRFSGVAGLVGPTSKVTIVVRRSGATVGSLTVKPATDGSYRVRFGGIATPGTYQVEATAPDGKAKASTSFAIVGSAVTPDEIANTMDSLVLASTRVIDLVQKAVAAQPTSPAKKEAEAKLDDVDEETAKLPAQVDAVQQAMRKVFAARAKIAKPIPEWVDYQEDLERWQADADRALARLEKLAKRYGAATEGCANLDHYAEMLSATVEAFGMANGPIDMGFGYWVDKIPGGIVARSSGAQALTSAERFALTQTMKLGASMLKGPQGVVAAIPGFMLDTAQWFMADYFGQFCEKWDGPIAGVFVGESFTKQGEPFFNYRIVLDGKLMFVYPKAIPAGEPIGLLGYIEGNGRFTIGDNPRPIVRLVPGMVLYHRITIPAGGGYWDELAQANRSLLPHSFRIPVKGVLAGDSIVMTVLPVDHDFSPVIVGVSTWVIMPTGGLVPEVLNASIPIQKAHPIIDRVVRNRFVLRIVTAKQQMSAERAFSRDTTNATKTARVRTTLTIKACNPGCLPLPLTPGGPKNP